MYRSYSRAEIERNRQEKVQFARKIITGRFHKGQIRMFQHGKGPASLQVLGDITGFSVDGNSCTVWVDNFREGLRDNHAHGPWRRLSCSKIKLDLLQAGRPDYNGCFSFTYYDESELGLGYVQVSFFPADRLYVRR